MRANDFSWLALDRKVSRPDVVLGTSWIIHLGRFYLMGDTISLGAVHTHGNTTCFDIARLSQFVREAVSADLELSDFDMYLALSEIQ